ncbi:MAG TPA: hypothetical protein VF137_05230 [Candidatus Dormibacteraeota bacterium]
MQIAKFVTLAVAAVGLWACGPLPFGPGAAKPSPSPNVYQQALAYSRCMRSHGIADFPDPGSRGGFSISAAPGSDLGPDSSAFQNAAKACQSRLPALKAGGRGLTAAQKQQLLHYSACMRSHGITDFPDPDFSNGGGGFQISGGPGSDLNPRSPSFQAAQQACQSFLPGKPTTIGNGGSSGSGSGGGIQTSGGG